MKRFKVQSAVAVAVAGMATVFASAGPARAGSDYSGAQFQVTWSLNCTNRSAACATDPNIGLGGFWGWAALIPSNTPGTGSDSGEETVCGHSLVPGPRGGAFHLPFDSTWFEFQSGVQPGPLADKNGNYLVLNDPFGLFPVPATYGHYPVSFEGATGEVTVAP